MANRQADLNPACHKNTDAAITKRDIHKATQKFPGLKQGTGTFRTHKNQRCLKGTVPIIAKGTRWNIPLCLWIMDTHPHIAPVCYIKPTPPMYILPTLTVLSNGLIMYEQIQEWKHPESDLVGVLQTLVKEFRENLPVYMIQDTDADLTMRQMRKATRKFPDLKQSTGNYGRSQMELRCLKGTLPVVAKGTRWNIPLCLWIMDTHPHISPVCYIKPTPPMYILPTLTVLSNGLIMYEQIQEWKHPESDIVGVLQTLVKEFRESLPVYMIQDTDADLTMRQMCKATQKFPDLKQSTGYYGRSHKELRCLKGTVPIVAKGTRWNIPLCLWIMDTHPHIAPVCYIKPTPPMYILPTLTVLSDGLIIYEQIQEWKHPESDLIGVLQTLVKEFKESLPVYMIQDTDADLTMRQMCKATQKFPDLKQSTGYYGRSHKQLRCLKGTVPIVAKGTRWNIPLCLWIMDTHPHIAPVCYIKPTPPMYILPTLTVLSDGLIMYEQIQEWKQPGSDLVSVLQTLVMEFRDSLPIYVVQSNDHTDITKRDIGKVIQKFPDLRHTTDTYASDDSSCEELNCLKGTLPAKVKGDTIHIPLCVWLMGRHPYNPPECYITPTANTHIKPSFHVGTDGKVTHPYLLKWNQCNSDLLGLLQTLVTEFGKRPPVVSGAASQEVLLARATTAETVVSGVEDVLQCGMCLDNMTDPRVLNCHHSFCKSCLEMLLQTQGYRTNRLTCPTCRAVNDVEGGSVENLPVDFKMRKLCELLSQHNKRQKKDP